MGVSSSTSSSFSAASAAEGAKDVSWREWILRVDWKGMWIMSSGSVSLSTQSFDPSADDVVEAVLPLRRLVGAEGSMRVRALPKEESLLRISMPLMST